MKYGFVLSEGLQTPHNKTEADRWWKQQEQKPFNLQSTEAEGSASPTLPDMARVTATNKMQSDTADFAPRAATCRTGRNVCVIFDSGLFAPL